MAQWTRRQVLTQMGLAAAAVHTLDPHELCCTMAAHAQTADKDLFELKNFGDGVYAAIAAPQYKTNCNAALIMTDDGVIVVDTHSKPSASRGLYTQMQELTKKPVIKVINTHFHFDHTQGNESYATTNPKVEIIATEQTKVNINDTRLGRGWRVLRRDADQGDAGRDRQTESRHSERVGSGEEEELRVQPAAGRVLSARAQVDETAAADEDGDDTTP